MKEGRKDKDRIPGCHPHPRHLPVVGLKKGRKKGRKQKGKEAKEK